jgi:hypothetical protein
MIDSNYIHTILKYPVYNRLRDWYEIGPVQRATLDEFVEELVLEAYMFIRHDEYGSYTMASRLLKHFGVK